MNFETLAPGYDMMLFITGDGVKWAGMNKDGCPPSSTNTGGLCGKHTLNGGSIYIK